MTVYERRRGDFVISTDPTLIDVAIVHGYLTRSYWSPGIPLDIVERAIRGSMPFGVYHAPEDRDREPGSPRRAAPSQIGFARLITDQATFAYLSDVFILEDFRGRGLSKWLVETILDHPELQGLRRWSLLTRDAQGLYERYGFVHLAEPRMYMERKDPDVYTRAAQRASE